MDKLRENSGVVNGVLFGLVVVILGMLMYFISKPLFLNPGLRFFLSLAIPIVFISRAALDERKKNGGFISFPEALQPAYICLIIGSVIFTIFQFIIMNADFELLEIQRDIAVESVKSLSGFANLTEENIAAFEEMTAEDLRPDFQAFLLGLAKNFILGFIIAAIIAAIVKRKNLASEQN
ncbi:DUF4199 domain-containing protein [Portibacter lacus]|uniref:DUF4199 domain-containing protein n=1 Tax=Portibacter lacus TaxID=1099794 RepID=A0AA37WCL7_9BACT|nr:DUF4199 domain-containing protein [Portibacter lacus]GLR16616.1 hypothetical protein GCM10007940_12310 [Portibacter lacus]